jgi:hypothetical protein
MASGFMNEHTAEFILVPDLVQKLRGTCGGIVPFHYWKSREGQAKARDSYSGFVRLVAGYARRPKVERLHDPTVTVKFNTVLFDHSCALKAVGVPVFAGVPVVSTFSDFGLGSRCIWFLIEGTEGFHRDVTGRVFVEYDGLACPDLIGPVRGPLSDEAIVAAMVERSEAFSWSEMFRRIDSVNQEMRMNSACGAGWYNRFMPYKPFYLALLQGHDSPMTRS